MIEYIGYNTNQFKANLHCHSTLSDGALTPSELKDAYKGRGYSILSITDHEYPFDHSDMSEKDFIMLTGYEAYIRPDPNGKYNKYMPEAHINLFARDPHNVSFINYSDGYCKYVKEQSIRDAFFKVGDDPNRKYTPEYINKFVATAKENGYICTHNHPVWSMEEDEQILKYDGFFSMEMCNYSSYVTNAMEYNANLYDKLLRAGKFICCHSTDDNHNKHALDSVRSDSFGGFTMVLANELTYDSVFEALENGRFYSSMGPIFKKIVFDGSHVFVQTSQAVKQLTAHFGSKTPTFVRNTDILEFDIPDNAPYVRINALDYNGCYADTKGFSRAELGI